MPDGADRQRARPRAGPLLLPHLLRDPQAAAADHRRQHVRERELSDGAAWGGPGRGRRRARLVGLHRAHQDRPGPHRRGDRVSRGPRRGARRRRQAERGAPGALGRRGGGDVPRGRVSGQHDVHQSSARPTRPAGPRAVPARQPRHVLPRARGELRRDEARVPGDRRIRGLDHPAPRQAVGVTAAGDAEGRAREVENLRAVYQSLQQPQAPVVARSGQAKKVAAGTAGAGLLFVLGKAKFLGLLAGVLKFKTLATMLISIGAYAIEGGWLFALGFVLLIFVHEMGHAVAMRIEGIPAGPPVFIPFVGAFVAMPGHPRDAAVEARVAMAGPVAGSLAAWATLWAGHALALPLLLALGHTAVLINLFNLVPVPPLDGGRIVTAFTRTYWAIGYAVGIVALLVTQSPLLLIVLVVGLYSLIQRRRNPVPGSDSLPPRHRQLIALSYAALVLALAATLAQ